MSEFFGMMGACILLWFPICLIIALVQLISTHIKNRR
jgi:hypothetical protein